MARRKGAVADAERIEELRAFADNPGFFERPEVRARLQAEGLLPVDEPETGYNSLLETDILTGDAADRAEAFDIARELSSPEEDEWYRKELAELGDLSDELVQREAERIARDRIRKEEPESREAVQQAAVDALAEAKDRLAIAATNAAEGTRDRVNRVATFVGNAATPGGIGTVLIVLFIMLFTLIPVNGQPRLVWLWLVLTGKAHLQDIDSAGQAIDAQREAQAITQAITQAATGAALGGIIEAVGGESANRAAQGAAVGAAGQVFPGGIAGGIPGGVTQLTPQQLAELSLDAGLGGLSRYVNP